MNGKLIGTILTLAALTACGHECSSEFLYMYNDIKNNPVNMQAPTTTVNGVPVVQATQPYDQTRQIFISKYAGESCTTKQYGYEQTLRAEDVLYGYGSAYNQGYSQSYYYGY